MGPRPGTPDSLPVIGALPEWPNIIVATGHGHLGLTGAPMTARIVAGIATGERPNLDLSAYGITRFQAAQRKVPA
jgi:glycine/D-amino acid oxidase-like deaminating enzyme